MINREVFITHRLVMKEHHKNANMDHYPML